MAAMNSFSMPCAIWSFDGEKRSFVFFHTLVLRVSGMHACSENRTARQSIHVSLQFLTACSRQTGR